MPEQAVPNKANALLLFATFIISICGLIYELLAGTISSYLLGDSVFQFSLVIGIFLAAMGVGGEHVDLQPVPQGGDTLGKSVNQNAVYGESAIYISDKVLNPQWPAARNGQFDHGAYYSPTGLTGLTGIK